MTAHPRLFLTFVSAVLVATAGTVIATASPAAAFSPRTPPLTTPWTNQVSTANPLPEYPRPQLTRTDWQSLNVSLESFNYPGYYWRHYAEAVYIATNGGGNTWDAAGSYAADATWNNASPLG